MTAVQLLFEEMGPGRTLELVRNGQPLWVEESGNPEGIPVFFLHGGPGSGCKSHHRRFFDPHRFRILLHDQRGCGRSSKGSVLELNTTQEILADLEFIRATLNIPRWILFGGSWGATLALLYAEAFPHRVAGVVLRGSFLARQQDLDWFIGPLGVRRIYPEAWMGITEVASLHGSGEVINALSSGIASEYSATRWASAGAWEHWGAIVTLGSPSRERLQPDLAQIERVIQQSRIELHYARHSYFIRENQILEDIDRVTEIPAVIIHGRRDLVCPCDAAILLNQAMPQSKLLILEQSAHIPLDDAMIAALIQATEEVAHIGFQAK
jgi:proline iminopeptidase